VLYHRRATHSSVWENDGAVILSLRLVTFFLCTSYICILKLVLNEPYSALLCIILKEKVCANTLRYVGILYVIENKNSETILVSGTNPL